VDGIFLGYSLQGERHGVQPLWGLPGAAVVGELLDLGGPFRTLAVSSVRGYALGVRESDDAVVFVRLRPDGRTLLVARTLPEASADRIVLSPQGSAALLYERQRSLLRVFAGFPEAPFAVADLSLEGLPGVLTALAVSDDGGVALAAVSAADGPGSIFVLTPGSAPRWLGAAGLVPALSFAPASRGALIADAGANQILWSDDVSIAGPVRAVARLTDGIVAPAAVEAIEQSRRFLVVNRDGEGVWMGDLDGGPPERLSCACRPAGLRRLQPGLFELSTASGPVAMLRADRERAQIFFAAAEERSATRPKAAAPRRR
jgi:hypothetical protein